MSVDFSKKSRTKRGREQNQAHTLDPWKNFVDGIAQEVRKNEAKKSKQAIELGDEGRRISGLREFAHDIKGMISESAGEKFKGVGPLRIFDVGSRRKNAREFSPSAAFRRLATLHELCVYERRRSDRPSTAPLQKVRPGLLKVTLPSTPWHDACLKRVLKEGAATPDEVADLLASICWMIGRETTAATKIGAAKAGVEVEFVACHLLQGVLHFHPYIRDTSLVNRERIGLFLAGSTKSPRPRLTLNSLGVGCLTQKNLRDAGMPAVPKILVNQGGKNQKGNSFSIIRDWDLLETALAHRAGKQLGPCWDGLVTAKINQLLEDFLAQGERAKILKEEKDKCRARYNSEKIAAEAKIEKLTSEVTAKLAMATAELESVRIGESKAKLESKRLSKELQKERSLNDSLEKKLAAVPMTSVLCNYEDASEAIQRICHGRAKREDWTYFTPNVLTQAKTAVSSGTPDGIHAREFLRVVNLLIQRLPEIMGKELQAPRSGNPLIKSTG